MSLYNLAFGVEPTANIALSLLGITSSDVPRFRDAYFTWAEGDELFPVIVIRTRTGGGNRPYYDAPSDKDNDYSGPWNSDLKALPGYRYDADDDFDSTYANFVFAVPEEAQSAVKEHLDSNGAPLSFGEKMEAFIDMMKQG